MSIQFLKNDISEKSFRKIYLITGNEPYLKNYYLTALKNSMMTKEEEAFDFVKTEGKNLSTEEFFDYTSSFPLSAEKKLIVIVDLPLSSPIIRLLTETPDILFEECCLVIYEDAEKYDKRTSEYKKLDAFAKKNGLSVTIDTPKEEDLVKWTISYLKKHNTEISHSTAEYFVQTVAHDMYLMKNEMDKLISYKSAEKKISRDDIDLLSTKSFDAKSYELTNAIFSKDYEKAYDICQKLLAMNTYPMIILYTIENAVAAIVKTRILLEGRCSEKQIAEILKIKEYPAKKNCDIARNISKQKLRQMLDCCVDADISSKSTAVSLEDIIYKLIAECISKL